ncbi:MAG: I78 family peptidase inhibitor [Caulobacter sp.]|nr:I78 family peptidase inhibitor [Caulobacter sp.]
MRALALIGVFALAACGSTPQAAVTPPAISHAPTMPLPPPPPPDSCGANRLQGLVGKPKTEIPVPVDPSRRRVACTTCPVTLDYRPERLNIFFDAETGIVKEVKCG